MKPQYYKKSKQQSDLWFSNEVAGADYFEHEFEGYSLEARILHNESHDIPWVFSIHGARTDFTKSDAVSLGLQQRGYSLLGMNLSGHSPVGVLKPEQTTLQNNINESEAFFSYLDPSRKKVVIAYSMGGTSALKLLERHADDIEKLVLFYPGIYAKSAYDEHFGDGFRKVISRPYSYRENDTIELLAKFEGKLLIIVGEYDGLDPLEYGRLAGGSVGEVEIQGVQYYSPIPKEVIDMICNAIPEGSCQKIVIPKCGHSVVLWMREHPKEARLLLGQIDDFLKN